MELFQVIGYYVCEAVAAPDWLRGVSHSVLSVSGCIGEQHPRREVFFPDGLRREERRAYQKALGLGDDRYREFSDAAVRLFTDGKISIDSRFSRLADARKFLEAYCSALPCRLVSLSTAPGYLKIIETELKSGGSGCPLSGEADRSRLLGNDILGWDNAGFHSFLCNSLEKQLPEAQFNRLGLLENGFSEVIRFAETIQGQGEPVVWVPCRVGEVR